MKKVLSFLLSLAITLSLFCTNAYASQYVDINLDEQSLLADASGVIENALAQAKDNASDSRIYRIFVPAGTYTLTSGLHIYSNTQLYLNENTVLNRGFESGNMIKAGLKGETSRAYDGYKNIVINGGVWDSLYIGESCIMRFAHCTNVTVSNLIMRNIKNAHHIEFAAADGFYLQNCTFTGMNRTNTSSAEAVQIDILHDYAHFPDYDEYDDTPCKNVYVTGCTFDGIYSGVGTRSGVVGSYFDNINITNNVFRNIAERAITCFNYRNSSISGNYMENVSEGITFEYLPSYNIGERFSMPNNNAPGGIVHNCNSTIAYNTMNINRLANIESYGIFIYGSEISGTEAAGYGVLQGKYIIKKITVEGNVIACHSALSRGIFLTGVYDSDIASNNIACYTSAADGINAINLCASSRNVIKSNAIYGAFNNGISLYGSDGVDSKKNGIAANSINNMKSYGIRIAGGSTASIKNTNSFSYCAVSNICIASKNYAQNLAGVNITSLKRSASGRVFLKWSAVDGADGYKIYRSYTPDGTYRQVATVKNKLMFIDLSSRPGIAYYYKISPYYSVNACSVISQPGEYKGVVI